MLVPPRGRPPTEAEVREYQVAFPFLTRFSVTGEADASYDCVSFTVTPDEPRMLRPTEGLVALGGFDALELFYRRRNFSPVEAVPSDLGTTCVALFGIGDKPTHVALRDRHTEWWESKLGTGVRILHPLPDLEGGRYGHVMAYYAAPRTGAAPDVPAPGIVPTLSTPET